MADNDTTHAAGSQTGGQQGQSAASAPGGATTSSASAMSAPSIPNLLSRLGNGPPRSGRGGRRGGGLRGLRGSHHGHHGPPHGHGGGGYGGPARPTDHNSVIQNTDTDAALSRLSAVDIGLLEDPFAKFFAGDGGPAPRRLPIINRGTYTRTIALDSIIRAFLAHHPTTSTDTDTATDTATRQVVSLGAGTDTRSFRFLGQDPAFHNVAYHEIDFPSVCAKKRNIVQSVPYVRSLLASSTVNDSATPSPPDGGPNTYTSWHADLGRGNTLWGHGIDLREFANEKSKDLTLAGLRTDIPTLLVSECCLCYLPPTQASAVLRWFSDRIVAPENSSSLGVVIYEPILPNDPFGRTMVANLASRGIEMPTLEAYPDGAKQEARLKSEVGLARASHCTIEKIWNDWVPEAEKERVNSLDGLDEEEEWQLLAGHYVVAWGSRGAHFDEAWTKLYES